MPTPLQEQSAIVKGGAILSEKSTFLGATALRRGMPYLTQCKVHTIIRPLIFNFTRVIQDMDKAALHLAQALIQQRSITPNDAGCMDVLLQSMQTMPFEIFTTQHNDTHNICAIYQGGEGPSLGLAGHTDVVPPGPTHTWQHDPFLGKIIDGQLYGRGAIDMKAALACQVVAALHWIKNHPTFGGRLVFLITSDEEGDGTYGMRHLLAQHAATIGQLDACLIGEPTSDHTLGDCLKMGRRGSINGTLRIHGKQGHVAYPEHAINPICQAAALIQHWQHHTWETDVPAPFPPTQWVCTAIKSDDVASNVIPAWVDIIFNMRHTPNTSPEQLQNSMATHLRHMQYQYDWQLWRPSPGGAFLSTYGKLGEAVSKATHQICGRWPDKRVDGGTSDGRFIHNICPEVIELGFCRGLAHHVDEAVSVADLERLVAIYYHTLEKYFATAT